MNHKKEASSISRKGTPASDATPYLSSKDLAERWRCSRPTIGRIAEREGFTRLSLGHGVNGVLLYLRAEIEAYEASRLVKTEPGTIKKTLAAPVNS